MRRESLLIKRYAIIGKGFSYTPYICLKSGIFLYPDPVSIPKASEAVKDKPCSLKIVRFIMRGSFVISFFPDGKATMMMTVMIRITATAVMTISFLSFFNLSQFI